MSSLFDLSVPLLRYLPPEFAHYITIKAIRAGLFPEQKLPSENSLKTNILGMDFSSPIGLAAGFDKNGEVTDQMLASGFGFVEVGTITPNPQLGNHGKRMFRLPRDRAVINRLGFNNNGIANAVESLAKRSRAKGPVAVNVGPNRDSRDFISDYAKCINSLAHYADIIVLNVSSPNTLGLRDLQGDKNLNRVLESSINARNASGSSSPILIKVAPDLDVGEIELIVEVAIEGGASGLIIGNTTLARPEGLIDEHSQMEGGLSGGPLFSLSTKVLSQAYKFSRGRLVLVGVGGVSSGAEAYEKICSGANLIELYTSLIYEGPSLIKKIENELTDLLNKNGFKCVSDAVGSYYNIEFD